MLCKELQYGDWCCDKHGFPMQITNVGDDYAYATFEGNEGDPWEYDDKDDQPCAIEITPDLLKANGWKIHTNSLPQSFKDYCYVKDESGNHLMWNSDVLSIWLGWEKDKDDEAFADIAIPIKYVHQLQQALRLVGMTDMANNFKV